MKKEMRVGAFFAQAIKDEVTKRVRRLVALPGKAFGLVRDVWRAVR